MVYKFIICVLNLVFYCKCQHPVNRPFTDKFSPNTSRIRLLTEATNRRILNQFQNQHTNEAASETLNVNMNALRRPLSVLSMLGQLERLTMENSNGLSDSFTNLNQPLTEITKQNLGNIGLMDVSNNVNRTPIFDVRSLSHRNIKSNSHTRGNLHNQLPQSRQHITLVNITRVSTPLNRQEIAPILGLSSVRQQMTPIMPSLSISPVLNGHQLQQNTATQSSSSDTEAILSEADLLQMGSNELSALGRHGLSLNSIVDTNFDTVPTPGIQTLNSSTEEQLIVALLERLIELQENRKLQITSAGSPMELPPNLPEIFEQPDIILPPSDSLQSSGKFPTENVNSLLPGDISQDQILGTLKKFLQDTLNVSPEKNRQETRSNQQTTSNSVINVSNQQQVPQMNSLERLGMSRNSFGTSMTNEAILPSFFPSTNTQQTEGAFVNLPSDQLQFSFQSIPCLYRGCSDGYYCVTTEVSERFPDFCSPGSLLSCKCSPGCNFQNEFLPETAVKMISTCRNCSCENGVVYCRFTSMCRSLYQSMRLRRQKRLRFHSLSVQ